jgi:ABC-type transport system involved in multi-copper enzyme maturation permease subunit
MTDKERVGFSFGRVWTIAANTFTESVRQKVFNILLVFALVVIACALFFRQFDFGEEFKFVKDFCLGAMSIFGTCIAIVGTSMLLPNEVEHRTIYTILSKPVRRFEFLLGKYLGSIQLVLTSTVLMSLMFGVVLFVMMMVSEGKLRTDAAQVSDETAKVELQRQFQQVHAAAMDPDIVKGVLLIFVKLCVIAGITLLISTFSTSMVFNVIVSTLIFIAGHLVGSAKDMWGGIAVAKWLLAIVPDLGMFNVADDIILGNAIPWEHVGSVALYGIVYAAAVVAAAHYIFEGREI